MKDLIRNILQEETSQEKLAKGYLSRLKLKPWKNDRYRFVFLATPKGTSIVLVIPSDHEFAVQDSTYDMLLKFLKTEDNVADFLYDYMIDLGIKLKFNKKAGWVSRSENVGRAEDDDTPYFGSNSLNENSNPLKNFWFKKWSKQKEKGENPSIYDIEKLGFSKKRDEIVHYFTMFMGYDDENSRSYAIKQYLLNHTFTEKEITDMDNFDEGKIKIKFDKIVFSENENVLNYIDLDIEFVVLSGSFYNSEEGQTYHFSSEENWFDDFVSYWDFKEEVENVIGGFVNKIIESFGFNIDRTFGDINVKWI